MLAKDDILINLDLVNFDIGLSPSDVTLHAHLEALCCGGLKII